MMKNKYIIIFTINLFFDIFRKKMKKMFLLKNLENDIFYLHTRRYSLHTHTQTCLSRGATWSIP